MEQLSPITGPNFDVKAALHSIQETFEIGYGEVGLSFCLCLLWVGLFLGRCRISIYENKLFSVCYTNNAWALCLCEDNMMHNAYMLFICPI